MNCFIIYRRMSAEKFEKHFSPRRQIISRFFFDLLREKLSLCSWVKFAHKLKMFFHRCAGKNNKFQNLWHKYFYSFRNARLVPVFFCSVSAAARIKCHCWSSGAPAKAFRHSTCRISFLIIVRLVRVDFRQHDEWKFQRLSENIFSQLVINVFN